MQKAIVRSPGPEYIDCISHHPQKISINYSTVKMQHQAYIDSLLSLGLAVTVLPYDSHYPDGCFVEDTAVIFDYFAVVCHLAKQSRQGEEKAIVEQLQQHFDCIYDLQDHSKISDLDQLQKNAKMITQKDNAFNRSQEEIFLPTLEGGDVMIIGHQVFVGLSARTNLAGINRLKQLLQSTSYEVITVQIAPNLLHLKTACSFLGDQTVILAPDLVDPKPFVNFKQICVSENRSYAANTLTINGTVLMAKGFDSIEQQVKDQGFKVQTLDLSEFEKGDGGLTCLSLIW